MEDVYPFFQKFHNIEDECSKTLGENDEDLRTSSKEIKEIMVLRSLVSVPTRYEMMNLEIGSSEAITPVKVAEHPVLHSPIVFEVQVEDKPSKHEIQVGFKVPNLLIEVFSIVDVGSTAIDLTIDI